MTRIRFDGYALGSALSASRQRLPGGTEDSVSRPGAAPDVEEDAERREQQRCEHERDEQ
jgi:hypothetical protein